MFSFAGWVVFGSSGASVKDRAVGVYFVLPIRVQCETPWCRSSMLIRRARQIDRFNVSVHSACWKKYGVRPSAGDPNPERTDYKYCVYDKMHNDYGYTQAWVDFLVEKLRDKNEFESFV